MIKEILILVAGFVLLIKGADWLVGGASAIAKKYRVSDLVIGLTIVAFGTSAPEMVVSVIAAIEGLEAVSLANVVGSNIFNLLIVLGFAGIITPLVVKSSIVWREIPVSLGAAVVLFVLANIASGGTNVVSRLDGIILLVLFSGFLWYLFRDARQSGETSDAEGAPVTPKKGAWFFIAGGLAALIFGGRLVVNNAVVIASALGMSEKMIGLTIVAGGTSLPELATSVVAAWRKNADIAVGNVIGSNIFNILFILGVSSVIRPLTWDAGFNIDMYVLAGVTVLLFVAMFTGARKRLDRWEALLFLVLYAGYIGWLAS